MAVRVLGRHAPAAAQHLRRTANPPRDPRRIQVMSPGRNTARPRRACATVPKGGNGSFDGMAKDPVATAASHNPALSTLVTAVKKAGLVDTLAKNKLTTSGSGESYLIDGSAKVVCGNVRTADATVHLIDTVLLPKK
ncbi:fasciclin domain-containing protein [Streptomyces sp. NBC_01456]|uniref:fasciclin domain-containing protein n=1 Tax=unclassified Streptomyces TaxID=2593676 RepID=UPI003FCC7876